MSKAISDKIEVGDKIMYVPHWKKGYDERYEGVVISIRQNGSYYCKLGIGSKIIKPYDIVKQKNQPHE